MAPNSSDVCQGYENIIALSLRNAFTICWKEAIQTDDRSILSYYISTLDKVLANLKNPGPLIRTRREYGCIRHCFAAYREIYFLQRLELSRRPICIDTIHE